VVDLTVPGSGDGDRRRADLRTPAQAREYLVRLRQILVYIGVNDGKPGAGSFRCDANISLRKHGDTGLGVKVESRT